jgi:hypothetical protein
MFKTYMKEAKHGNRLNCFSQAHLISKYNISVISPSVSPIKIDEAEGKQSAFVVHICIMI